MAEFIEVIQNANRMCKSIKLCEDCPIYKFRDSDGAFYNCPFIENFLNIEINRDMHQVEHAIQKWAEDHPSPVYPTWYQWWEENFKSEGRRMLKPCAFVSPKELGCSIEHDGCMQAPYKCWHKPIPDHVAKKLGVKPLSEKTDVPSGDTLPDSKSSSHGNVFVVKC